MQTNDTYCSQVLSTYVNAGYCAGGSSSGVQCKALKSCCSQSSKLDATQRQNCINTANNSSDAYCKQILDQYKNATICP
jgi:hypothetical protein